MNSKSARGSSMGAATFRNSAAFGAFVTIGGGGGGAVRSVRAATRARVSRKRLPGVGCASLLVASASIAPCASPAIAFFNSKPARQHVHAAQGVERSMSS